MPYVNITLSKKMDSEEKNALQQAICNIMPVLPGKNADNTLIAINDNCAMFNGGKAVDGIFADIKLYKSSPEDAKKEFAKKIHDVFKETLGITDKSFVYMNFTEMPTWSSNGSYS